MLVTVTSSLAYILTFVSYTRNIMQIDVSSLMSLVMAIVPIMLVIVIVKKFKQGF